MKKIITVIFAVSSLGASWQETTVPNNMSKLIPAIKKAIPEIWPTIPYPEYIASQIEQETCISPTGYSCGNPKAELKTSREYGFGLGQLTIAYTDTGKVRFNSWEEIKTKSPLLKNWAWEDRFNADLQIKAILVKNYINWRLITFPTKDTFQKMAILAATYNGGSVLKDRQLCLPLPACDSSVWFNSASKYVKGTGIEAYSTKSKVPQKAYGDRSFFEISREYPRNVMLVRLPKYAKLLGAK